MQQYYYKDFKFDAFLFLNRLERIYLVPKTRDFYERFILCLESLKTDNPNQEKIYKSLDFSQKNIYETVHQKYSHFHIIFDENIDGEEIEIESEGETVIFRYNTYIIDTLKKEMKEYDTENSHGESTFTHGMVYCPYIWFRN